MSMSFMCNIWYEMINTLRAIPSNIKIWLYVGSIILILLFLRKAIKVNWHPKNEKKRNFAWFLPVILLLAFVVMLTI